MSRKLNIEEVCEYLNVSRNHLAQLYFRAAHDPSAAPPRIRVSPRKFLWDEDSLETWLKSRETHGSFEAAS